MAANETTAPPDENKPSTSLERERLLQSPDLEPLLLNPQTPPTIPTTVQTLRRIFEDTSLSHEEQDSFAESILAIVRKQPGNPKIYQPVNFEEELEKVILEWVGRVMMEFHVGISSVRDDWSGQQGIRMPVSTANGPEENQDKEGVEVIEREEEGDQNIDNEDGEYKEYEEYEEAGEEDEEDDVENTVSENNDFDQEPDSASSVEDNFMIWEHPEVEAELAWHQTLGRNILPEHFALFKRCITERIRHCAGEEKEVLYQVLSESQITWLIEPVPENSSVKMPEKEQVWIVIWSVIKYARLLLRAGGGAVQGNTRINEYVAIMVGVWWLVRGEPFEYITKAQRGGPEVYMSAEGWVMSEEPWAEMVLSESLGGSFEQVRERVKARKEAGKAARGRGGEADPTRPHHTEDDADIMSAREDLVRGILEEALMGTTRSLGLWSESVDRRWQRAQAGNARARADEQDPSAPASPEGY
ncbi:hypothetical protein TWF506_007848 [Arthrobotrys conoides]|uniref:Uncharacterized protein n=1 Tax=Arthrobotrys conoides TaxID=74498 RepID=A0AAN8NG99_9PEZI